MSTKVLVALLEGSVAGAVQVDRHGRTSFTYDEGWRGRRDAFPLSLSMPLAAPTHERKVVDAYLWGLLPDSEVVLDGWGRKFGVSPRNATALLAHIGEDCPGAVQFADPDRVDALMGENRSRVAWLTESDVERRLRDLRRDPAAWRSARDSGQFSLAGAQPKTAFLCLNGRYGVPSGRTPTTHILKPPSPEFPGHAENEHLCLTLAQEVGLPAANSKVQRFGGEVAIVVERFDRIPNSRGAKDASPQPFLRVHQEDCCQALGVHPDRKYQNEGGPSPARIVELLRDHSASPDKDVDTFLDAVAFSWLTGAPDAHAKNYALLHVGGGRVRLAPLYDLASVLPYPSIDPHKLKLAMRIGSRYLVREIALPQWRDLAAEVRVKESAWLDRIREMAREIPPRLAEIGPRLIAEGLDRERIARLVTLVSQNAKRCSKVLA